jgi:DUF4097 and DUF4098 domain-containing protein YvlB
MQNQMVRVISRGGDVIVEGNQRASEAVASCATIESRNSEELVFAAETGDDVHVSVPRNVRLSIESGAGNVRVHDVGMLVVVTTESGDVDTSRTFGRLVVRSRSGEVNVVNHDGSMFDEEPLCAVAVDSGSGDVALNSFQGKAVVRTESGSVFALGSPGVSGSSVTIKSSSGDVEVRDVSGGTVIKSDSGDVELVRIGGYEKAKAVVKADSGDVNVRELRGPATIVSESGDIDVVVSPECDRADLLVHSKSGEVNIDSM